MCAASLLLHLPHVTGDESYPSVPFLFVEGSHYDIGHQIVSSGALYYNYDQTLLLMCCYAKLPIAKPHYYNYSSNSYAHSLLCSMQGSAFREQILTAMQNNSFFNNKMLSYNATAEGRALYSSYYHTVLHTFPLFLDEVRGMADGSKILFSKVSQSVSLYVSCIMRCSIVRRIETSGSLSHPTGITSQTCPSWFRCLLALQWLLQWLLLCVCIVTYYVYLVLLTLARACAAKGYCSRLVGRSVGR